MNEVFHQNKEILRLKNLGWCPPESDSFVYERISFNEATFDPEGGNFEKDGFWNAHRLQIVTDYLHRAKVKTMWEIGAGDGNIAVPLSMNGFEILCVEPLVSGANNLSANGLIVFHSTLQNLNLPDNSVECIGMFDVLGHVYDVDKLLTECHRVLKPQGHLILSVPAHEWLYSNYDVSIKQLRRFSMTKFFNLMKKHKFQVIKSEHVFAALVPVAILTRLIPYKFGRVNDFSKVKESTARTLRITRHIKGPLSFYFRFERLLRPKLGLSIFMISTKS
jgi:2-polyprenyl-3-methyl-5-hydroxy-6-metoxy-1,4-benzoquinol methylase